MGNFLTGMSKGQTFQMKQSHYDDAMNVTDDGQMD